VSEERIGERANKLEGLTTEITELNSKSECLGDIQSRLPRSRWVWDESPPIRKASHDSHILN